VTWIGPPRNLAASAELKLPEDVLTTIRTPAAVFFGIVGFAGVIVAEMPWMGRSSSPIFLKGI
jgi:hypothetical protein